MSAYKTDCKCGFGFVFGKKPTRHAEAKCPKCGEEVKIDPAKLTKVIEEKGGNK